MSLLKHRVPSTLETFLDETRKVCANELPVAFEASLAKMQKLYEIDPVKAIEELHHLKNKKHAREGMALKRKKDKEQDRLKELAEAAKAIVLVEKEQDAKQRELYKRLLDDGHSADEICTRGNEESLAPLFIAATVQASGRPVSLRESGRRHTWFIGEFREAEFDEVLHSVEPESFEILAGDQIHFAEVVAKYNYLAKQKAAGLIPGGKHLLSEKWQSMVGDVASRRLKAIEDYLTANGTTDLWNAEESNLDPYLKPRPWQQWTWVLKEKPEPPKPEPRSVPLTITPPSMLPPEPHDISKTEIVLDGKTIILPLFPSTRM